MHADNHPSRRHSGTKDEQGSVIKAGSTPPFVPPTGLLRAKSPTPALLGSQPVAAIPVAFHYPMQARAVYSFDASSTAAAAALMTQGQPVLAAHYSGSTLSAAQHKSALERERERERERDRERDRDRALGRRSSGSESSESGSVQHYTAGVPLRTKRKMRKNNREKQRRSELNDKVSTHTASAGSSRVV